MVTVLKPNTMVTVLKPVLLLVLLVHNILGDEVTCQKGLYPPPSSTKVPTVTINLDLPPEERWTHVVKPLVPQMKQMLARFRETLGEWGPDMKMIVNFIEYNLGPLDEKLPQPFAGEIMGISKATGMQLGDVVLYNIFYELSTFCTSIVTEDASGKLYSARNMDFGFGESYDIYNKTWYLPEMLRPLLVNAVYTRGGQTVFKAAHYAGYIGVVTGVKPNAFTLAINARNGDGGGGFVGVLEWLLGRRNGTFSSFLSRSVVENATSFQEAHDILSNKPILAPIYYILGGKNKGEGTVITRNKDSAVDVWPMTAAGGWYILETNYDHWVDPFPLDDRRDPANQCMKEMAQQGSSFAGLFNVLSTQPVLNKGTVYTSLMQVDSGELETYIRFCADPCPPW